jgi:hypothetical protein
MRAQSPAPVTKIVASVTRSAWRSVQHQGSELDDPALPCFSHLSLLVALSLFISKRKPNPSENEIQQKNKTKKKNHQGISYVPTGFARVRRVRRASTTSGVASRTGSLGFGSKVFAFARVIIVCRDITPTKTIRNRANPFDVVCRNNPERNKRLPICVELCSQEMQP